MSKRFKVEFVGLPDSQPFYFETKEEVDRWVASMKAFPLTDNQGNDIPPAQFRITEFLAINVKIV
jgi:hypothetical protein